MKIKLTQLLMTWFLIGTLLFPIYSVSAQTLTANDLISTVNALRAANGLAAYQVDSSVMTYAQQHADYMASIQSATHTHSDGSTPWASGYQENVASGSVDFVTLDFLFNQVWADAVHSKTILGYESGKLGAGVAAGADGNLYLVLNVLPGNTVVSQPQPTSDSLTSDTPTQTQPAAIAPTAPLVTATTALRSDAPIEHIVVANEALWSIAMRYGVKIDEIRQWNGLAAGDNFLIVGQKLKIFLPVTATPEMTSTNTPLPSATVTLAPPTNTPQVTPTSTNTPTATITPTQPPDVMDLIDKGDKTTTIIIVIVAGLLGVLLVQLRGRSGPSSN
jgi:LysM repeat protein